MPKSPSPKKTIDFFKVITISTLGAFSIFLAVQGEYAPAMIGAGAVASIGTQKNNIEKNKEALLEEIVGKDKKIQLWLTDKNREELILP